MLCRSTVLESLTVASGAVCLCPSAKIQKIYPYLNGPITFPSTRYSPLQWSL